ncbi:MAG: XTP/dITP diphosphatase [Thermoplasmata archaeon]
MKIVTHNKNKYLEYKERFEKNSIDLEWINLEYVEIQSGNPEEIVEYSVNYVKKIVEPPFFLEDAGLAIKILKGFPGPYSSFVHDKIGNSGILKLMEGIEDREAVFYAIIGFFDGHEVQTFKGSVQGEITKKEKGSNGFGYDPIFRPLRSSKTFAEMEINEKNLYSHRSLAFDEFVKYLKKIQ